MIHDCFAITAPGLEPLCATELVMLGETPRRVAGGVEWSGDARSLYRSLLLLRTASRVIVRAAAFRARGFPELERHAGRVRWSTWLGAGTDVQLRVTSRKSRLYHEGAIAERLARVLGNAAGVRVVEAASDDDGPESDAILLVVRVLRDDFTISIDATGRLLHQRGYRRSIAMAPLRETLAAALLMATPWNPATPLLDPFCGSGTIPIEAALMARRIPPGLASPDLQPRSFALQHWAGFDRALWSAVVAAARDDVLDSAPAPIVGADRHAGAIAAALQNAQRAGVAADIELRHAPLERLAVPPGAGAMVTNPPYGIRIGERRSLRPLYDTLGRIVADRLTGWRIGLLAADPALAAATGMPLQERLVTRNGGLDVRLLAAGGA